MKEIFYKKAGRRYVPVSEYDSELMSAFPRGAHLVMSYPGGRSTRYNVDVAYAPMIAASRVAEDTIARAIMNASEMRPHKTPVTEAQAKAWRNLQKEFGDERYAVIIPAARDIAEAGVKAMQDEAMELMANPNVKKAYEEFMLVCKLAKTESKYD